MTQPAAGFRFKATPDAITEFVVVTDPRDDMVILVPVRAFHVQCNRAQIRSASKLKRVQAKGGVVLPPGPDSDVGHIIAKLLESTETPREVVDFLSTGAR